MQPKTVREMIAILQQVEDQDLPVAAQCCVGSDVHPVTGGVFPGTVMLTLGVDSSRDEFDLRGIEPEDLDDDIEVMMRALDHAAASH